MPWQSVEFTVGGAFDGQIEVHFNRDGRAEFKGRRAGWPIAGEFHAALGPQHLRLIDAAVSTGVVDGVFLRPFEDVHVHEVLVRLGGGRVRVARFHLELAPPSLLCAAAALEAVAKQLAWIPTGAPLDFPDVPAVYQDLFYLWGTGRAERDAFVQALPFSDIVMVVEDAGADFRIALSSSGTAHWDGSDGRDRSGRYQAELSLDAFSRICWFIGSSGIRSSAKYRAPWMKAGSRQLSLRPTADDGDVVDVVDYGRFSPIEVQVLFAYVEWIADRLEWTRVE